MDAMNSIVQFLALKAPFLLVVFSVMGVMRAINKPLFAFARAVVLATPSTSDDAVVSKIEASKLYSTICKILDYVASIKIGTEAPVVQAAKIVAAEKKAE